MNMSNWRSNKMRKANKGSQTPGKAKGLVATPIQRYMCTRNRSWKHPRYEEVMASIGSRKRGG